MRNNVFAVALMLVIGVTMTLSQASMAQDAVPRPEAGGRPGNTRSSSDARALGNAPIGHRQPTAADSPANDPYAPSAQDKELDRKIRSICKGC